MTDRLFNGLFLCTGNAARSITAVQTSSRPKGAQLGQTSPSNIRFIESHRCSPQIQCEGRDEPEALAAAFERYTRSDQNSG
jgi:hypothetical protein